MDIKKVVNKYKIGEEPTDFAYWQSKTYQERLEALEQIRKEYHSWSGNAEQGLHRVYRIVRRQSDVP